MLSIDTFKSGPAYGDCVEQFFLSRDQCRQWPFFAAFDGYVEEFLTSDAYRNERLSYALWGGVASEVVLGLLGLCTAHFSLHDIEFFLVRNGEIVLADTVTSALNEAISTDTRFLMELGGLPIVTGIGEISVLEFQRQRTLRNDGDLYLNGLLLSVNRESGVVNVSAPIGTMASLANRGAALLVKNSSDIDSIERASRRIFRNVAKAIRFECVAGLTVGRALEISTIHLVRLSCESLGGDTAAGRGALNAARLFGGQTCNVSSNAQDRKTWLWATTLSETTKRLAGLSGCSSLDRSGFADFFSGCVDDLLMHPLTHSVGNVLEDSGWVRVKIDAGIVDQCFADFQNYQKPFAELLRAKYSLLPYSVSGVGHGV